MRDELGTDIDNCMVVAVTRSEPHNVLLWFLFTEPGRQPVPFSVALADQSTSMDRRVKEIVSSIEPGRSAFANGRSTLQSSPAGSIQVGATASGFPFRISRPLHIGGSSAQSHERRIKFHSSSWVSVCKPNTVVVASHRAMIKRFSLLLVPAALLLTGCGSTRIGRILRTGVSEPQCNGRGPRDKRRRRIVAGVYEVEDESGKIYVLSSRGVPNKGARVKVEVP